MDGVALRTLHVLAGGWRAKHSCGTRRIITKTGRGRLNRLAHSPHTRLRNTRRWGSGGREGRGTAGTAGTGSLPPCTAGVCVCVCVCEERPPPHSTAQHSGVCSFPARLIDANKDVLKKERGLHCLSVSRPLHAAHRALLLQARGLLIATRFIVLLCYFYCYSFVGAVVLLLLLLLLPLMIELSSLLRTLLTR